MLRRAAELEDASGNAAARGLTSRELEHIGRDVGFSPDIIQQALAELDRRNTLRSWNPLGPSPVSRSATAVPGVLSRDRLKEFIRIVEDNGGPGTVTEALGTVRWTSVAGSRVGRTTQVSVTPASDETHVQVLSRYPSRVRVLLQAVPASWGLIIGSGLAQSAGAGGLATAALAGGVALVGGLLGRAAWTFAANRNERDTGELVDYLGGIAARLLPYPQPDKASQTE